MMTVLVAVASLSVTGYACVLAVHRQQVRAADSRRVVSGISALVRSRALLALSTAARAGNPAKSAPAGSGGPLALTASERRDCPAVATACVDLTGKISWLQASGKVTYGPVRIEPGPAGKPHATPTGTFRVTSKAGPGYRSTAFHDLGGWAVFSAPGGVAFCQGSLTQPSDGCVHLTLAAARFYRQHLPVGAEVAVFLG
ncbi:MAG TPA: L,D-transpeptidase [Trebonia sp.]|nr:L,D-transpeptidase [Trebonia sp.]